jgi:DNA-binding transcriptional ArsR family regulator
MATRPESHAETILTDDAPVTLPALPATLVVNSAQQFKAIGDHTRSRILDIIKHEPATAKQIGDRLNVPHGTIGHHLQVLEAAGLAQVVARRLVHGIVAKYFTRTARLYLFDFPPEVAPATERQLSFLTEARDQLAEALLASAEPGSQLFKTGFPHARLTRQRAEDFGRRLFDIIYEFATEPPDPAGEVYALCTALFLAPPYMQGHSSAATTAPTPEM